MIGRPPSKASPMRFWVLVFAGVLVLAAVTFVFVSLRPRTPSRAALELDRKIEGLRNDGVPLTAAQIGKIIPDPDAAHDARLLLRPAFAWSPGSRPTTNIPIVSGGTFPERSEPVRVEAMSEIALFLTNSDAMVSAMPERFDGIWFSMGWTNGFTNVAPIPIIQIRQLAQALALKALYESEKQNSQKAADAVTKGFGLTRTLNGDSFVSTMIRVAVANLMCDSAQQVLNRTKLTDAQLRNIQENIVPSLADDFAHAHIVERQITMNFFDPIRAEYQYGGAKRTRQTFQSIYQWLRGNRKPAYRDEDYLLFLNTLDERRAIEPLPGLERLKRTEAIEAHYRTNLNSTTAELVAIPWGKAMRAAVETRARLENVKAAVAVERCRLAHSGKALFYRMVQPESAAGRRATCLAGICARAAVKAATSIAASMSDNS